MNIKKELADYINKLSKRERDDIEEAMWYCVTGKCDFNCPLHKKNNISCVEVISAYAIDELEDIRDICQDQRDALWDRDNE